MVGETTVGPQALVERMLADYGLGVDSWAGDIVERDTDRLLMALLLEQRGEADVIDAVDAARRSDTSSDETTADYWSSEGAIGLGDNWTEIEFGGLESSSIDLRITNADVVVRFAPPGRDSADVYYATAESPIVGEPVETTKMWAKTDPSAGSNAKLQVQAWG